MPSPVEDSMLQSNGTFYWPAQENHGKQSVQGTAPCKLPVWMTSLNTNDSLELVFIGHPPVQN